MFERNFLAKRFLSIPLVVLSPERKNFRVFEDEAGLIKPHFAFLLGARSEVRDKRLLGRAKISSDIEIERNSAFLDRVADIFMSFGLIYIDTSDITAEEVANIIKRTVVEGGTP